MGLGVVHVSDTFTDCGAVEEGGSSQELLWNEEVLNNVLVFFVFFSLVLFTISHRIKAQAALLRRDKDDVFDICQAIS